MPNGQLDPATCTRLRLLAQQDQRDAAIRDYLAADTAHAQRRALIHLLGYPPDAVACRRMAAVRQAWAHERDNHGAVAAIGRVAARCESHAGHERASDDRASVSWWKGMWGHWAALSVRMLRWP